uniref:mRNA decay factor PAT1 domain-containing protein n=1 Tax=Pan paniscus TaxID=9597 RepID=A0A2R9A9D7_PANPA
MFHYESWEDCLLDEDEDEFQGLREEDVEIDQFNDDIFGSGAADDDWQEAHERLAELEEKLPVAVNEQTGNGEREEMDLLGDHEENLAERLSKMVIENELEDPAIMRAVQTRPVLQPQPGNLNSSIWDGSEEMSTVSVLEYALPQRWSTSPVIGSPPVRAVPIGTPPKQMAVPSFTQQSLCTTENESQFGRFCVQSLSIFRPPMPPCYPGPYDERMPPNQLYSVLNSSLLGHPFPPSVPPVLILGGAQLQPGQMSPSQFAWVPGFVGSPLAAMNPKLLQGQVGQMLPPAPGFHAFFSAPPSATPPPQQCPPGPGPHLQNLRSQVPRQQQNRNQHQNLSGAGDRGSHWRSHQDHLRKDPYANLMLLWEKDWASKIQMMQLQSNCPHLDDFYYQNYFEKLEKPSAAEEIRGDGPKKEHTKLITPQVAKLERTYKPVQFVGSLGKLTVSSVNNPRKMIDAVKTYSLLLDVEDYERHYLLSLRQRPALMDERKYGICSMYDNLRGKQPGQERSSDDRFVQIMCIQKGKTMVARILPFLSTEQAADIFMTTARDLPFLIKKDAQDEVLPCLLSPFSLLLYHLPTVTITSLLQQLMNLPQSAATPAPSNPHFTAVETPSPLKIQKISQAWWHVLVVPATREAEAGEWREPGRRSLQ